MNKQKVEEWKRRVPSGGRGAAPFLFTFLPHPGMQPTNNHAERELLRRVSGRMGSVDGMRRFGVPFTRLLAWRKRKPNICRELDRVLLAQT